MLVGEYLAVLADTAPDDNSWAVPPPAREVFQARISRLNDIDRQTLTTAAAVARLFSFDTVCDASGRTEDEVLVSLERLQSHGLLRERGLPRRLPEWEFTHEKLREVPYESMTATRRRVVHQRSLASTAADDLVARS